MARKAERGVSQGSIPGLLMCLKATIFAPSKKQTWISNYHVLTYVIFVVDHVKIHTLRS